MPRPAEHAYNAELIEKGLNDGLTLAQICEQNRWGKPASFRKWLNDNFEKVKFYKLVKRR